MQIERTKDEVIFRLPANIDIDDLQAITDLLMYKEITSKFNVSQEQVDDLVKDVKKVRSNKTKLESDL